MHLRPEDFPPGAMEYAQQVARVSGKDLAELVSMYGSQHPEVVETVGRRVGEMSEQQRMQMLVLAIALLADMAPV